MRYLELKKGVFLSMGQLGKMLSTRYDLPTGEVLDVTTQRVYGGALVSRLSVGKNTGTGLVVFEGLGAVVLRSEPSRLTEKVLVTQHSAALEAIKERTHAASIQTFKE
jgi:hypothetical protein